MRRFFRSRGLRTLLGAGAAIALSMGAVACDETEVTDPGGDVPLDDGGTTGGETTGGDTAGTTTG